VAWPGATLLVIAVLFGVQLVIAGIFRFVVAFAADDTGGGTRAYPRKRPLVPRTERLYGPLPLSPACPSLREPRAAADRPRCPRSARP
jgi:hypothetical protein